MIVANHSKCAVAQAEVQAFLLSACIIDHDVLLAVLKLPPCIGSLLGRVTDELYPDVGSQYTRLGLNLGMNLSEIKVIEHDHQDAYRRLVEIVNWWLKRQENEESSIWRKIIKCLERIEETELARKISDKYHVLVL